jgi:nicotinamidase-related amidase
MPSPSLERLAFLLSTEQAECLIAFEEEGALAAVARRLRRDASVISRALKSMADLAPLVEKSDGKWRITPLGRQFNRLTRSYLATQQKILSQSGVLRLAPSSLPSPGRHSALLLLGGQEGFLHPMWGPRNQPEAELRIEELLTLWRKGGHPIVHCPHLSLKRGSPLRKGTEGARFIEALSPREREEVIEKSYNSAFVDSTLEKLLRKKGIENLIVVGFTTNHCVDATTRAGFDLGFHLYVVSDAVATFDRVGPDGKQYPAEVLHNATLTSLHQEYATIVDSELLTAEFAGRLQ